MKIAGFNGRYRWLSNFAPCFITGVDGRQYPSVEHAYQAAKLLPDDLEEFYLRVQTGMTAAGAKSFTRYKQLKPDWLAARLNVMYTLVYRKFQLPLYRNKLLATGDAELVEDNWWNDTYWGVCNGRGENHLGKILMAVRDLVR